MSVWTPGASPGITAVAVLSTAVIAGAVLGMLQATALAPAIAVRALDWVAATSVGTAAMWAVALIPMLYGQAISRWPPYGQTAVIVATGIAIVFAVGVAQAAVLRRSSNRARLWIWANALGWAAGLTVITLFMTPLWLAGHSTAATAETGVLAGVAMAVVVAAVTGAFLPRVVRSRHTPAVG